MSELKTTKAQVKSDPADIDFGSWSVQDAFQHDAAKAHEYEAKLFAAEARIAELTVPARHEHEAGAPLIDDCDNWCRTKYNKWITDYTAKIKLEARREALEEARQICITLAKNPAITYLPSDCAAVIQEALKDKEDQSR